jgi:hypothetical protein
MNAAAVFVLLSLAVLVLVLALVPPGPRLGMVSR